MDATVFGPGAAAVVEEARRALEETVTPTTGAPGTLRLRTVSYPRSTGRLAGFERGRDAQELATEIDFNETGRDPARVAARRLIEATAAMVLERQAMFGPVYHYPRTFVVGPDAFTCKEQREPQWVAKTASIADDGGKVHVRDVDQLVWIKHCAESKLTGAGIRTPGSTPVVEVVLLRLNHDDTQVSAVDGKARPSPGRAVVFREYAGGRDPGFPKVDVEYVVNDLEELGPVIFSDFNDYNLAPATSSLLELVDTAADFGRSAAAFLERASTVRGQKRSGPRSIVGIDKSVRTPSVRDTVFWATLAGYILPAHPAEDPRDRPTVPVGAITPERLIQVALAELPPTAPLRAGSAAANFVLSDDELF